MIVALLALGMVKAEAQDFEGTIRWSIKMEMSDPATQGMTGPSGITIKMKDGNSLMTQGEGGNAVDALYLKSKDVIYTIDRRKKIYRKLAIFAPTPQEPKKKKPEPIVTKTTETKKILGYNCTKYISVLNAYGQTITSTYWATTDIEDIDFKAISRQLDIGGNSNGSEPFPLLTETVTLEGKTVLEVISIKREQLSASDFVIPDGFMEK